MTERNERFENAFNNFKSAIFFEGVSQDEARRLLALVLDSMTNDHEAGRIRFIVGFGEVCRRYNGTFSEMVPR